MFLSAAPFCVGKALLATAGPDVMDEEAVFGFHEIRAGLGGMEKSRDMQRGQQSGEDSFHEVVIRVTGPKRPDGV